jgi:drug/metabolite transporter (DMT)-like permease
VRWLAGALILVSIVLWREGSLRIDRRDLVYLAPAVLIGVLINQIAFNYSVDFATASTVALVFGTLPIFAAILTRVLGWAQLRLRHWIATVVSFVGVALVAIGAGGTLGGELGGILLALLASATFAGYSVAVGPLMRRYSPLKVSALVAFAGSIPLTIVAIPQLATAEWGEPTAIAWGALAYLIFMFVTTTIMWFTAIDRVGAPHATLWSNLQPFLAALIAVLILSEPLGPLQITGGAVIALSIAIARWRSRGYVDRVPDVGRP